jgi:hypothetical protein
MYVNVVLKSFFGSIISCWKKFVNIFYGLGSGSGSKRLKKSDPNSDKNRPDPQTLLQSACMKCFHYNMPFLLKMKTDKKQWNLHIGQNCSFQTWRYFCIAFLTKQALRGNNYKKMLQPEFIWYTVLYCTYICTVFGSATPHTTHLSSTDLSTVLCDPLSLW